MKKRILYLFLWLGISTQAQWTQQNSGTTENLNDVYCISADTVVVVGDNTTILRTTNGGTDWLPVSNPATGNLHKVQFADTQTGYAVGDNGILLKTIDAGVSWQSLTTNTTENLLALSVVDANTLFVGGTNGLIMKSVDSGGSWVIQNSNNTDDIIDIQIINSTGFALSDINSNDYYLFYKTNDLGINWTTQNSNILFEKAIFFTDELHGTIVGQGVLKTIDGGTSFSSFPVPDPGCSNDVYMFSETKLWLAGWDCRMGNSTTGGFIAKYNGDLNSHYYDIYYGSDFYNAIHFANRTNGYVVGDNGVILKNPTGSMNINKINNQFFSINPNPAQYFIAVNFNNEKIQITHYKIISTQGQLILEDNLLPNKQIDVSSIPSGIYLLKLTTNNSSYIQKLIIQK
jgi:photosystem II stability/assembly factor-like uncharacterized protein